MAAGTKVMDGPSGAIERLLLVGSSARERSPVERRSARSDRWFEPLHVQDPGAARERIALQIAAGADIVVTPTWRTHRRALMEVGESRRAREWTLAAVRVAREGIEDGLERRASEVAGHEGDRDEPPVEEPPPLPILRPTPRIAGMVPDLEDEPDPGTGRLRPTEPAAARDYDEIAGHLADGEVDLILVETRPGGRGVRMAVEAAARLGLPTWAAASGPFSDQMAEAPAERQLAPWTEACVDAGASGLLMPDGTSRVAARLAEALAIPTWGGLVGEVGERSPERLEEASAAWLGEGARTIGLLRGARAARIVAIRAVIDRVARAELERAHAEQGRWHAFVERAARMAPGGAALWLAGSSGPDPTALPVGFRWTVATPADVSRLPSAAFRLVVAERGGAVDPTDLAGVLEVGGILVSTAPGGAGHTTRAGEALRLLVIDEGAVPHLAIFRREG